MKFDKIFITTFNKTLYNKYAYKLLNSYTDTAQNLPLFIFTEDFENPPEIKNVHWVDLNNPELNSFISRNKHNRHAPTYMQDAVRFCYKVFCQYAAKDLADKVFFLDADCIFLNKIPDNWFDHILPDNVFTCFYDRPGFYTECGFVGFNCTLDLKNDFFNKYMNLYLTDKIYELPFHTDCHAFDYTRELLSKNPKYLENKLGQFNLHKTLHVMKLDPTINNYIDHKKGNRKYGN
jgi:hypothetical protein